MKELIEYYKTVRQASIDMVQPLKTEDFGVQAAVFASPPKWNLAHTSWFFEAFVLQKFIPGYKLFHPKFNYLFNSYYNTAGERTLRDERGQLSRPTVAKILDYRHYVDKQMLELISAATLKKELYDIIVLGLNHEQQHQELFFTDLKFNLSVNPLFPIYDKALCEDENTEMDGFVELSEGIYEIGYSGDDFCYDNEGARHRVFLESFALSKHLVTNGEFISFIEDGGYQRFDLWHEEGLTWLQENNISHPLYWHKIDNNWFQFTLGGLKPVQVKHLLSHISFFEAAAFAQWRGMRLPTEFEWEAAADLLNWGKRWEWTESAYLPYPGFRKPSGAVGEYNGKFMLNQKVLRGASVATPLNHSRKTYRNFFHPQISYQFNGIRLAKLQELL